MLFLDIVTKFLETMSILTTVEINGASVSLWSDNTCIILALVGKFPVLSLRGAKYMQNYNRNIIKLV